VWLFGQETLIKTLLQQKKPNIRQGLPVEKKALATIAFISALLSSALVGTMHVNLGSANPYIKGGNKPPPEGTQPPTISILSPNNNTVYASGNITLTFNVTTSEDTYTLYAVYFEVDWQEGNTSVYYSRTAPDYLYNKNITGIPEGKHIITITAAAHGYYIEGMTSYSFDISGSSTVYFSIEENSAEEPCPTPLELASVVVVAVIVSGLLVNFKKQKW
jgi:hypothetical protein